MNRIEELTKDIQVYLAENDMEESDITRPDDKYDNEAWLQNLCNVTNEVSIITIESIEDMSERWWQITYYIKIEDSSVWYTIILNNSADIDIQSIENLAEVIYDYERLASKLTLTIKDES